MVKDCSGALVRFQVFVHNDQDFENDYDFGW
jgi:hypothetical protein